MTPARNMTAAHAKVRREGRCRTCHSPGPLEAAHIVSRAQVGPSAGEHPDNIIPLCVRCHRAYDTRRLDVLLDLTPAEIAYAKQLLGEAAMVRRVMPIATAMRTSAPW